MKIESPFTKTSNTLFVSKYETSILSDSRIMNDRVDNYFCLDTGLFFNASGPRTSVKGFYTDEYDLHSESTESEFKYFDNKKVVGIYDDIANFISGSVEGLVDPLKILDIGCGKGLLLSKLRKHFFNAKLFGIEPSRNSHKFFQKVLPEVTLSESTFEDSPFINKSFNLIVANGVLEHVPDPISFLNDIRNSLDDDGYLYIGVPNFENNPADVFTFDHLTRFTPSSIDLIFKLAGFKIVASKVLDKRVPMWFVAQKTDALALEEIKIDTQKEQQLIKKTVKTLKSIFKTYDSAAKNALEKGKKIALYGTGAFGLIATEHTQMRK